MRLYQITGYGFPDLWAQSFQTARTANGFLDCGIDTTVVYPASSGSIPWETVGVTYGLSRLPPRRLLNDGLLKIKGRLRYRRASILRISLALMSLTLGKTDVVFGRHPDFDPLASLLLLKSKGLLKARVFVDLHEVRHYSRKFDEHISGYVVTNQLLSGFLKEARVREERILVAPHAVDLRAYEKTDNLDVENLRQSLGIGKDQAVVCYTGQLRARKNVETVIDAMKYLPDSTILLIAGGADEDHVRRVKDHLASSQLSHRVKVLGQQSSAMILRLQIAADALVIPHDPQLANVMLGTPLKLPEYLATGKPVVAYPAAPLLETLRDDEVVWAKSETAEAFADAIMAALQRKTRGYDEIKERMGGWTWADRSQCLSDFMGLTPKEPRTRDLEYEDI